MWDFSNPWSMKIHWLITEMISVDLMTIINNERFHALVHGFEPRYKRTIRVVSVADRCAGEVSYAENKGGQIYHCLSCQQHGGETTQVYTCR